MSRDGTRLTYAGIEYRSHDGKWVDEDGIVASLETSRELDAATQNKVAQTDAAIRAAQRSTAPMRSMMRDAEPDVNVGLVDFLSRKARLSSSEMRKVATMLNMAADLKDRDDDTIKPAPTRS